MSKITKNELKRNELEEWLKLTTYYIKNNFKVLIITITSVIFVIIAGSSILYMKKNNNKKSSDLLSHAIEGYHINDNAVNNSDRIQIIDSISILKGLIEDYPNTQSAALAYYYLGNMNYKLGNLKEAMEYYKHFSDKYSGNELINSVKINMANIHELKKEYDEAVTIYENLLKEKSANTNQKNAIKFNLGRVFELKGQTDKAKEIYSELKDNDQARFRLSCLLDKR